MPDRIWTVATPLTPDEQYQRFDFRTDITIEGTALRQAIRREWVRGSADQDGAYGYAESRGTDRFTENEFKLRVPFKLDFVALSQVILGEIQRQASIPGPIVWNPTSSLGAKDII